MRGHVACLSWTAWLVAACMASEPAVADRAVPLPALDGADPSVHEQLTTAHAELLAIGTDETALAEARAEAYGHLGRLFLAASLPDVAAPALLNARVLAPDDAAWPYHLGHVYRGKGNLELAADMFAEAARIAPEDVPARIWLGRVALERGRVQTANEAFLAALAVAPGEAAAMAGLGQAALAGGDPKGAVPELERALTATPGATALHYPLGLAYRAMGDEAAAQRHLAQWGDVGVPLADPRIESLDLLLNSALAYQRRGLLAMGTGDWQGATELFRDGLRVAPDGDAVLRVSLLHKLGSALALMGDQASAVEQFEAGIALAPGSPDNHYSLGLIAAAQGDVGGARRRFETALAADPTYVEARLALGNLLRAAGQAEAALAHFEQVLELMPDSANARYARVVALADLGRTNEARDALADGLERHPGDPRFRSALAALAGL